MSTDTSLVPIVSSQLAPITTDSEFMPPEWAHLIKSVQIEWYEAEVTPYWSEGNRLYIPRRCRIEISMKLDYGVIEVIHNKQLNCERVRGSGIIAYVSSISITRSRIDHTDDTVDVILEGYRE